jgi:hypothetical protein
VVYPVEEEPQCPGDYHIESCDHEERDDSESEAAERFKDVAGRTGCVAFGDKALQDCEGG